LACWQSSATSWSAPALALGQAITFGTIKKRKLIVWKGHRYGVLREFLLTDDKKVHLAAPEIVGMIRQLAGKGTTTWQ